MIVLRSIVDAVVTHGTFADSGPGNSVSWLVYQFHFAASEFI